MALAKKEDIEFIDEAENGIGLLNLLEQKQPDVILLDIRMPLMDGLETLPMVRNRHPLIKVIMLTMFDDPSIIIRTLELGAHAYLTASSEAEEIYSAIISCFGPGIFLSKGARHSLNPSHRLFDSVSEKEMTVIQSLANSITEEEIARQLNYSVRTIKAIIDRLLNAARVSTIEELIDIATQKGFLKAPLN